MLSDSDYYEQVLIADDELMHEFVNNELSEADHAKFKKHALSVPQRRQGVKFVKALQHYVNKNALQTVARVEPDRKRPSWTEVLVAAFRKPAFGFSCCVALLIMVTFDLWLLRENQRLRNEVTQGPSQQTRLQKQLDAEQLKNLELSAKLTEERDSRAKAERDLQELRNREQTIVRSPPPNTKLQTFPITLGLVREGGTGNTVSFRPGTEKIKLNLDLAANDYRTYKVALKRSDAEKSLWSSLARGVVLEPEKITLPVVISTTILTRGEYQLDLSGITPSGKSEHVATYNFRVP
jgi:hypothetical protein